MTTSSVTDTGKPVSLLGFGIMRMPKKNAVTQRIDRKTAAEMIDFAIANGVNYFDTAYIYHLGDSESFIGEALKKYPRESFNLATKLPTWLVKSERDVEKFFNRQLEKCQTDYFDFYLVHSLNNDNRKKIDKYNIYEILSRKKAEGKIKNLGFSFHDKPPVLKEIACGYDWDFAQIQLNYLDWELQDARTQYQILRDRGIHVIVMEPVRGGTLATLNPKSAAILKEAAPDKSLASWAIRYAASLPGVLTVLSGMSNLEQVKDNLNTMSPLIPFSEAEYKTVTNALAAYKKSAVIPCTACRYCMPCPMGVDIPGVFAAYNLFCTGGNKFSFSGDYDLLGNEHKAAQCVNCGKCTSHCPQSIKIPDWLGKINTFANSEE
ncbi:MAG: aldo/keto reductase [Clostridiaceae bacterium]|nr:aldo/keto reductase [Clostridiaceae bacterium]